MRLPIAILALSVAAAPALAAPHHAHLEVPPRPDARQAVDPAQPRLLSAHRAAGRPRLRRPAQAVPGPGRLHRRAAVPRQHQRVGRAVVLRCRPPPLGGLLPSGRDPRRAPPTGPVSELTGLALSRLSAIACTWRQQSYRHPETGRGGIAMRVVYKRPRRAGHCGIGPGGPGRNIAASGSQVLSRQQPKGVQAKSFEMGSARCLSRCHG